jgi:hypothetical protein
MFFIVGIFIIKNMKKFIITEDEKSRILGMHQSATARQYLMEQSGTTKPQLGGGSAPSVMTIPGSDKFMAWNPSNGQYRFEATLFRPAMVNYLGGEGSYFSGIIGKTILITKQKIYEYEKMVRFGLPNNSVDGFILGSFVPKAWYVGASPQSLDNQSSQYVFLFNREITTNYSGDIEKPFIEKGVAVQVNGTPSKADLIVPIKGGDAYGYPYVDDNKNIPETLQTRGLTPITDYIRIRIYDGYCPEYKGYVDYLNYVGIPKLGKMEGVRKVG